MIRCRTEHVSALALRIANTRMSLNRTTWKREQHGAGQHTYIAEQQPAERTGAGAEENITERNRTKPEKQKGTRHSANLIRK